jgi:predicted transposase/invertase (TIGR01784 family)
VKNTEKYARYVRQQLFEEGGNIMATIAEKWKKEGKKEGKKEEKLNIARELVKNGVDINIISRSTGLPLEKLKELASMVQ